MTECGENLQPSYPVSHPHHPVPIIRTKLYRPPVADDVIERELLCAKLNDSDRVPLTLVSAPAGYGKSTLISHWLTQQKIPSAWVSLDERDSDLKSFLTYLLASLRQIYPQSCEDTQSFLESDELPPPETVAAYLSNDMEAIGDPLLLALDDYHRIHDPGIHELIDRLLEHPPSGLRLVIMARRDPPLSLQALRGRRKLSEIRAEDLQFSRPETAKFFERATGVRIEESRLEQLFSGIEGWPVGLRLVAMALSRHKDIDALLGGFKGDIWQVQDYLLSEVLNQQEPGIRDWLYATSILERFCPSLCKSMKTPRGQGGDEHEVTGKQFIGLLQSTGLFCIPLDDRHQWFRYHHLFQELLQVQLEEHLSQNEIAKLHEHAANWFEQNDLIDESLHHWLKADQPRSAAALIARNRGKITSGEQWHRLDRWLQALPQTVIDNEPELLVLNAWSRENRGYTSDLGPIVDRVQQLLENPSIEETLRQRLNAEIDALRSALYYYAGDGVCAQRLARRALETLPTEYPSERAYALIFLAVSLQMTGDLQQAYQVIYEELGRNVSQGTTYHGRMLITLCFVHWMAGDLAGLWETSAVMLKVGRENGLLETTAFALYFRGIAAYHRNQLDAAEDSVRPLLSETSIPNINSYLRSMHIMVAILDAKGSRAEARELVSDTMRFLLERGVTYQLPSAEALGADLALRQGRSTDAIRWAKTFDASEPKIPYGVFMPELVAVRALLSEGNPGSLEKAGKLLARLCDFLGSRHNTRFLIETLALEALLRQAQGADEAAVELLGEAVSLAQPGGFIRLFVDLGPDVIGLLNRLQLDEQGLAYVGRILAAFQPHQLEPAVGEPQQEVLATTHTSRQPLPEPLTKREVQILDLMAKRLSNKEIGEQLFIAPVTVKRHAHNLYEKLGVHGRLEAVAKATGLGILSA